MIKKIQHWVGCVSNVLLYISMLFIFLLILITCVGVVGRYVFSYTANWLDELRWHLFGIIFFAGGVYALKENAHVRVDVFYSLFSIKTKAVIDLLGSLIFLLPICYFVCVSGYSYTMSSFDMGEFSENPGGLPYRWLIKGMIPLGFFFLFLQAIAFILKQVETLMSKSEVGND